MVNELIDLDGNFVARARADADAGTFDNPEKTVELVIASTLFSGQMVRITSEDAIIALRDLCDQLLLEGADEV